MACKEEPGGLQSVESQSQTSLKGCHMHAHTNENTKLKATERE